MFYCPPPSASAIPEVHCLISPHQCLPPQGRFDLLIGSCDQTYGGTEHRPQPSEDKSRLVGGFPLLFVRAEAEQQPCRRGPLQPLDVAGGKQIHPPMCFKTVKFYPVDINSFEIIHSCTHLISVWFSNNITTIQLYNVLYNVKYLNFN